jgi:hypothetical protein
MLIIPFASRAIPRQTSWFKSIQAKGQNGAP